MKHRLISFFDTEVEEPRLSPADDHPPPDEDSRSSAPREPEYFVQLLKYLRERNEAVRIEQQIKMRPERSREPAGRLQEMPR
jgi:hypothetical protein